MIKGKTLIELTDVKTGKVERYEDENIITNAAQLYANAMSTLSNISEINSESNKMLPLYRGVFGGIKLFQNTIEESTDNWHMPKMSGNKIIGYASCDKNTGTDAMRGSINLAETVALENGMQLVWDFETNEANGTISCVCLTSGYGGEYGYNLNGGYYYQPSNAVTGYIIGFDKENGYIYTASGTSGSQYINKYKISLIDLKLDEIFCTPKLISTLETTISFKDAYPYYTLRMKDPSTLYATTMSGSDIVINYYDINTGEIKETKTIPKSNMDIYLASNYANGIVLNGYAYFIKRTKDGIYKIDLSNTSNAVLYEMEGANLDYTIYALSNGDMLCGDTVFSPENGDFQCGIAKPQTSISDIEEIGGFYIRCIQNNQKQISVATNTIMLHSINNLDTPVTKTADKTMKITYTLTYSDTN